MKRNLEIGINVAFWIISVWVIFQLMSFNFHEVDVRIIDGEEIVSEVVMDLSSLFYFGIVLKIILFYLIVFYLVPRLFFQKKYVQFAGLLALGVLFFLVWELIALHIACGSIHPLYLSTTLIAIAFYSSVAVTYGIIRSQLRKDTIAQRTENEKLQTELKLLRSQINPHFLFNALNNLLAISEKAGSQEVSRGISELSDLLRFLIYDAQTTFIPLQKEIEFIESYIALHGLRYAKEDQIDVSLEVHGINPSHKIAPALLIPFVENAFKHGVRYHTASFVTINLQVENNRLIFEVKNSKHPDEKNEWDKKYSGVGLENVKKRLKLMYENEYDLDIEDRKNEFSVVLKLNVRYD